jgi:hypothetical protein
MKAVRRVARGHLGRAEHARAVVLGVGEAWRAHGLGEFGARPIALPPPPPDGPLGARSGNPRGALRRDGAHCIVARARSVREIEGFLRVDATKDELDERSTLIEPLSGQTRRGRRRERFNDLRRGLCGRWLDSKRTPQPAALVIVAERAMAAEDGRSGEAIAAPVEA